MNNQYHILNGDCLKEQFPKSLNGELIVARECLVDGDVSGESLQELLETRAKFISSIFPDFSVEDYHAKTATEINKILEIPNNKVVNLWFEDDLFCQVNFWFVLNLLCQQEGSGQIFLVRPIKGCEYNFGMMSEQELLFAYGNKVEVKGNDLIYLSRLWNFYQNEEWESMISVAKQLQDDFPFVLNAVQAQIERLPNENYLGRPKESLKQIVEDLGTTEFASVFKEFCKRESIYGFGDSQVRVLLDELLNE